MLNFLHSGNIGDIIYGIPCILSLCKEHNKKANIYLRTGAKASYYDGAKHPLGNVQLNDSFAEKMKPLLESQFWCNSCEIYKDQKIDYNLDLFRIAANQCQYRGYLAHFYFYTFFGNYDLSQPWLWVKPNEKFKGRIVVNRTWRYRANKLDYHILENKPVSFVGLDEEYKDFKTMVPFAEWVPVDNFLEMAEIIRGCGMFIGNASFAFALAEALKVKPRILEVASFSNSVVPHGKDAYSMINQLAFESIFSNLYPAIRA